MNYEQCIKWNSMSYGSAIRVQKWKIKSIVMLMAVIIPIIFPVPVAMFICKFIKKDLIWRYE